MNWNELTARERDAVVATKVMDWNLRLAPSNIDPKYTCVVCSDKVPETVRGKAYKFGDGELCIGSFIAEACPQRTALAYIRFNPSTNITHAWLVVERMSQTHTVHIDRLEGDYNCFFQGFEGVSRDGLAQSPTAPEAICLAACRAMGVEV